MPPAGEAFGPERQVRQLARAEPRQRGGVEANFQPKVRIGGGGGGDVGGSKGGRERRGGGEGGIEGGGVGGEGENVGAVCGAATCGGDKRDVAQLIGMVRIFGDDPHQRDVSQDLACQI